MHERASFYTEGCIGLGVRYLRTLPYVWLSRASADVNSHCMLRFASSFLDADLNVHYEWRWCIIAATSC